MEINLVELWEKMGLPVKAVVIVLTLQAVASLGVAIDRLVAMFRNGARSRAFSEKAAPLAAAGDDEGLLLLASKTDGSYLAALVYTGLSTYFEKLGKGGSPAKSLELARRALERKNERIAADLSRGMGVLASTGSTAPFVGLLGTVLGIINAFKLIAANGSGGLGTIGAAIGEALIVTGYGLCVAIPTVLLFNWVNGRITHEEMALQNAAGELIDRLESLEADESDSDARAAAGVSPATPSRPAAPALASGAVTN
jgi:biopolymer transport protein ExbB/TolQ